MPVFLASLFVALMDPGVNGEKICDREWLAGATSAV
jgi:hypothetical protein